MPKDRNQEREEQEELRRAFFVMGQFDLKPMSGDRSFGVYTREGGMRVGSIRRGVGNLLFRTLALLSDHARRRSLQYLPYPKMSQYHRGQKPPRPNRRRRTPPLPDATPTHLVLPTKNPETTP